MAKIPKEHPAKTLLDMPDNPEYPRPYLGLSMIGHHCPRYLQYYWRMAFKIATSARMKRIFDAGHDAEKRITKHLGVTKSQQTVTGFAGHWIGHIDGILGKSLIEIKTFNNTRFGALLRQGVKRSNPSHYDQMQAYMSDSSIPNKAIYIAINKNDSMLHIEDVEFDEDHAEMLRQKSVEVVTSYELLPKIGTGASTWIDCKYCDARNICHFNGRIEENCRTCNHVVAIDDGAWRCSLHKKELTLAEQINGCQSYKLDKGYFNVQTISATSD